ncbi:MAG: hypothetical protein JWM44_2972 [Bacilli bacterium]|nr:hypothetical protein [Bacilli bacterium]
MKSRKFPTFDEAKAYLESRGKLEFFGKVGDRDQCYVYTLTVGVKVYLIFVWNDGLLEVTHERYV